MGRPGSTFAFSACVNYKSQPSPQPLPCSQQSATQQQHVQSLQTHVPLWQQPQQSHTSQPACDATLVTTATGAKAITAHRIKRVMEKLLGKRKGMNETPKYDQSNVDRSAGTSNPPHSIEHPHRAGWNQRSLPRFARLHRQRKRGRSPTSKRQVRGDIREPIVVGSCSDDGQRCGLGGQNAPAIGRLPSRGSKAVMAATPVMPVPSRTAASWTAAGVRRRTLLQIAGGVDVGLGQARRA